jgi:hypothetical protein
VSNTGQCWKKLSNCKSVLTVQTKKVAGLEIQICQMKLLLCSNLIKVKALVNEGREF